MNFNLFKIIFYLLIANVIFAFTTSVYAQSDSSIEVKIINTNDLKLILDA